MRRTRAIAGGIMTSFSGFSNFSSKKTYYSLETMLSLPGISLFNCIIAGAGFIFAYLVLPETENRSLEEIELHFSDDSKKLTDRNILRNSDIERKAMQEVPLNEQCLNEN